MTFLGSFGVVIGKTPPKLPKRKIITTTNYPKRRTITVRIYREFVFESENFAQKNERSLSEVLSEDEFKKH